MIRPSLLVIMGIAAAGVTASAQSLQAVRPLAGYVCMRLNVPRNQIVSRDLNIPVYAEPSQSSEKVGQASAALIVRSPLHVESGFAEILFPDGRRAWIQKTLLRPYATPEAPEAHCTPAIMSNGRIGFE
jgi:hypothetical protein